MKIQKATEDENSVLSLYDKFNDFTNATHTNGIVTPSRFSRENSSQIFKDVVNNNNKSRIFIAMDEDKTIGLLEIHKVPRVRKANYYCEIECLFVLEEYRRKNIASKLIEKAFEWAKEENIDTLRLYSGQALTEAHLFYEKLGFEHAGRTYRKYL